MVLVEEIAWRSSVWIENEPNNIVHFERIGVKMKYNPETVKNSFKCNSKGICEIQLIMINLEVTEP